MKQLIEVSSGQPVQKSNFKNRESITLKLLSWNLVLGICTMSFLVGCGHKQVADYETPDDVAQKALTAALTAWQNGEGPDKIQGSPTPVQVIDDHWQNGDKLQSFEILGEEEPAIEGPSRWFSVKLVSPDGKEQTVRYILVGKGSVWIYREDDFARIAGMEGGFPKKKARAPRKLR